MPFCICYNFAYTQRSKRDTLVYLYLFTDHGGFSNYDTRTMVDKKRQPDFSPGMDVYTRFAMRVFSKKTREDLYPLLPQLVRKTVHGCCIKPRISHQHFFQRLGSRIKL